MLLGKYALVAVLLAGIAGFAATAGAQTCDDFNDCTVNDMCSDGECHGTPGSNPCDDGNPCTINDTCTPDGCTGTPADGGACDDNNPCTSGDACLPGTGACLGFEPGTEGADCSGGCGTCQPVFPGVPQLTCQAKPDANNMPCTGLGEPFPCIDNRCSVIQGFPICLPKVRVCPDTDTNPCTQSFCNFETDQCMPNQPKCVTFCETCNQESGQCLPANLGQGCDDFNACTAQSTCQPFESSPDRTFCQAGTVVGPTATATPALTQATATPTVPVPPTLTATTIPPTAIPPTATLPPSTPTATRTRIQGTPTATLPPELCVGDCNNDGHVRTNELILGVEIALERADLELCSLFDSNDDNEVSVDEIVSAVNGALHGCTSAAAAAD